MKLSAPCTICHSINWCGRQCKYAPPSEAQIQREKAAEAETEKVQRAKRDRKDYMRDFMRKKRGGLKRKPKEST